VLQVAMKRISDDEGLQALAAWKKGEATSSDMAVATRYCLQVLRQKAPGRSVEVRVPPFGAAQVIEGVSHTRGTPPAVVEMSPETWLAVASGGTSFISARDAGDISASGERADLTAWLPLSGLA
jgi:hypothetical protein